LAGVLIVHVHVLVPVHDASLTNATVVKLHAGLVYEYVYRFAVNVYASSANEGLPDGAAPETQPHGGGIRVGAVAARLAARCVPLVFGRLTR
jgi:hypothetical protein